MDSSGSLAFYAAVILIDEAMARELERLDPNEKEKKKRHRLNYNNIQYKNKAYRTAPWMGEVFWAIMECVGIDPLPFLEIDIGCLVGAKLQSVSKPGPRKQHLRAGGGPSERLYTQTQKLHNRKDSHVPITICDWANWVRGGSCLRIDREVDLLAVAQNPPEP